MKISKLGKAIVEEIIAIKDKELNKAILDQGIDLEITKGRRRFPLITSVQSDNGEFYYFNNGTVNGLFLIGFELVFPDKSEEDDSAHLIPEVHIITDEPKGLKIKDKKPWEVDLGFKANLDLFKYPKDDEK